MRSWFQRSGVVAACGASALLWCSFSAASAQKAMPSITLDGHATLLLGPGQPEPVRLAAQDLASDMQKVFGTAPKIVASPKDAGSVVIAFGDDGGFPSAAKADHDTAPEAFSITSQASKRGNGQRVQVIRLAGSDLRGTLFAIYQFSQQYLDVDPMYYWTDHLPEQQSSVALPASLDDRFPAPVFRYRGLFINDEDLLTGWAPGEAKDHTGIALDVWNKIYETTLRLKGNMVVAGTWPFPDEPQDRLAARRGLLLNQHHAEPLGVNFSRWPKGVPYNFTAHPESIENAWKNAVAAYPADQQILWEIGLRGLSDQPYSALDPSVRGDEKAQGHLISKALPSRCASCRRSIQRLSLLPTYGWRVPS